MNRLGLAAARSHRRRSHRLRIRLAEALDNVRHASEHLLHFGWRMVGCRHPQSRYMPRGRARRYRIDFGRRHGDHRPFSTSLGRRCAIATRRSANFSKEPKPSATGAFPRLPNPPPSRRDHRTEVRDRDSFGLRLVHRWPGWEATRHAGRHWAASIDAGRTASDHRR
jgi:hypothetical protein